MDEACVGAVRPRLGEVGLVRPPVRIGDALDTTHPVVVGELLVRAVSQGEFLVGTA